eukprot:m.125769 g.125769  ORF g.125769 m.125769 type:complete len:344 (+) comp37880_c0_seq3:996-2027(+)
MDKLTIPKFKKSTEEINRLVKLVKDKLAQAEDEEECAFGKRLQELCYDELLSTRRLSFPEDLHVSNEPIPRVPYAVPLFICGLHLFCGSKGCTLLLLQLCREMTAVDFNTFFNPALTRNKPSADADSQEIDNSNLKVSDKTNSQQAETESPIPSSSEIADSDPAPRRKLVDRADPHNIKLKKLGSDPINSVLEETYTSLTFIRASGNITSREGPQQTPLNKRLLSRGRQKKRYDLVVITCLEPHFQPSSARVMLELLLPANTQEGCLIVLAVEEKNTKETENALEDTLRYQDCERLTEKESATLTCVDDGAKAEMKIRFLVYRRIVYAPTEKADGSNQSLSSV